jgi:hypothetical protein
LGVLAPSNDGTVPDSAALASHAEAGWTASLAIPGAGGLGVAVQRRRRGKPRARQGLLRLAAALDPSAPGPLGPVCWPRNSPPRAGGPWRLAFAHSGAWTLAAATARPNTALGADIERCRPRCYQRLERFLGWPRSSASLAQFYRRWTLAESCFKAAREPEVGGADARTIFAALDCAADYRARDGALQRLALPAGTAEIAWHTPAPGLVACTLLTAP